MLFEEEDEPPPSQAWIITFSELMALLFACFVLLVSVGQMKNGSKFASMSDSMRQMFGPESTDAESTSAIGSAPKPVKISPLQRDAETTRAARAEALADEQSFESAQSDRQSHGKRH